MIRPIILLLWIGLGTIEAIVYDSYSGKPVTRQRLNIYRERNNTEYCVVNIKPCDPTEWKRVDGSCNNLKHPSRGTMKTPFVRLLPHNFSKDYDPRKAKDGGPLPLARRIRTQVLMEGKASDLSITMMVVYVLLFGIIEINTIHDIINDHTNTSNCCERRSEYICAPNEIPEDDPVHRYSGVRCMNNTRPQTFQYFGCADFGTTPFARITFATPTFDLSTIYGAENKVIDDLRTFKNGLLKMETENGQTFPPRNPNFNPDTNTCRLNQPQDGETRCHLHHINGIVEPNICTIFFYRLHNHIAKVLFKMNPHWDDNRLFYTARDINIAIWIQIFFYELLPVILGRKNMIKDGIISSSEGFRDVYDENILPQISDEYIFAQRWFHTVQEGDLKLYDKDGHFLREFPIVNSSTRTGYLAVDDNMNQIVQGSFRQLGAKFDYTIDYDLAERIFGGIQYAVDGSTSHINKGRYFGFQPYVKYREFCAKKPYKTFESLKDVMRKERIDRLQKVYKDIEDVDLIAGIWAENPMPGAKIPYTLHCLMAEQLKRTVVSDRHWYERPNRPHAFTADQLKAIRRATIAGVWCTGSTGSITKIQPKAFYKISPKNPLTDCKSPKIGNIDLSPWKEEN